MPADRALLALSEAGDLPLDVGVAVITRDRRDTLLAALERLAALPERPPVVVVDNGSSDGTPQVVRERFPDVDVVAAGRNLGAAGRNVAARRLRTALVAFSDDDSWWAPGALARAARTFAAHPRLALLAARVLVGARERLDPVCEVMRDGPLPAERDLPGPPVLGFVACGAVVRRGAFLAAGGFHPRLGVGGEEALLAADLAAQGWGLAYVPDVVAHHRPVPGERPGRDVLVTRNRLWLAWLRRPVGSALAETRRALSGPAPTVARAAAGALRGARWVAADRRVVPPHVERALQMLETPTTERRGAHAVGRDRRT